MKRLVCGRCGFKTNAVAEVDLDAEYIPIIYMGCHYLETSWSGSVFERDSEMDEIVKSATREI